MYFKNVITYQYSHYVFLSETGECYFLGESYFSKYKSAGNAPVKIPQSDFNHERIVLTTGAAYTAIFFTENGNCFGVRQGHTN